MGSYLGMAQNQLNSYKYIVVPKKLADFKKENQYLTSTLIKYQFAQRGFTVVYDDALPMDLNENRCLGLFLEFRNKSSMFVSKGTLVLKDCSSKEIFVTQEGRSKIKEYKEAYAEVIREAFISFDAINYAYKSEVTSKEPLTISFKDDVKKVDKVVKIRKHEDAMINQKATLKEQSYKSNIPVASNIKKATSSNETTLVSDLLYGQKTANGFQLIDSTPKIVIKLFKTSVVDSYIAHANNKNGIVYKKEGQWFFEYYKNEILVVKLLNIKF